MGALVSMFPEGTTNLRIYQQDAIARLRRSLLAGNRRPILQAPTGSGKTLVSATIIRMALEKGKRVCFCVPALSLIDQTIEAFAREGIWDIGVIQSNNSLTDWSRPVQIASVQTLARRWPQVPDVDMVIVDEAHILFRHYGVWMTDPAWHRKPFVGLSATPWTRGLGKLYDDLVVLATTGEMIDQGYLSPFKVFAPSHPDLKGVRTVAGEYHEGDLSNAMQKGTLVADIVKTWLARANGVPTLCFAVDRAHAKHIQEQFQTAGVSCGYQDMNTTNAERRELRDQFHRGELKVIANVDTLTVGVDWDVRCISLARPTRSIIKFCQIIGRGLRTAEGKDFCTIFDHSDNHLRLGFVTDIHQEYLDGGKITATKKTDVPLPKECSQCSYLMPPRSLECPACGFKVERKVPLPELVDGDLEELRVSVLHRKRQRKKAIDLDGVSIPLGQFYGELKFYCRQHSYKPGWAANKYRTAIGVWPNAYKNEIERPPCAQTLSWIKSQNIRWAKSNAPR